MYLFIDTTSEPAAIFLLASNMEILDRVILGQKNRLSELLIVEIDNLLKKNKSSKENLQAIFVHPGPGSYTGVRIGVATANLLAFSLNIPVYGFSFEKSKKIALKKIKSQTFVSPVLPIYKSAPTITQKKSRLGC